MTQFGAGEPQARPATLPWYVATTRLALRAALLLAALYALSHLGGVIVVVLVSVLLAFTLAPAVDWLGRTPLFRAIRDRKLRRNLAATVIFVLVGAAMVQVAVLVVRPLAQELWLLGRNWPEYQKQISAWAQNSRDWYATLPPNVRQWVEGIEWGALVNRGGEQLQHVLMRTLESGMLIVELILIPVLAFSFLTESRPLKREFALFLPSTRLRDGLHVLRQCGGILQSYAIGQLILALIAGAVVYFLMVGMGIKYALAMSVVAAVTRVIPVVGPVIGGIPILLLCALQGPDKAIIALVAFSLMHLIESKVVMPRLIGHRINLHPAVVIIVLLIGAEFFGMWGMFLAAPAVAIARALFYHFAVRPARLVKAQARPPAGRNGRAAAPPAAPEEADIGYPAVGSARSGSGSH